MSGLQYLKLDRTALKEIPEELGKLNKLEQLSMKNNGIEKLYGEICELPNLRALNIRHNAIKTSGVPNELFNNFELTTLDLSHNKLKDIPEGLEKAKGMLVLNLSYNL
jgi:Leucine-rich repeat (LRR) protein